jgi:anti-sigma regulatory factor (Ser/Thr protein kinase)
MEEPMTLPAPARPGQAIHAAFLYGSRDQFLSGVAGLVKAALSEDEPVLMALPGRRLYLMRDYLGEVGRLVRWVNLAEVGANPGRIIPAIRAFVSGRAGRRSWCVHEPVWEGRSSAETREAMRHEALINLAFADEPVTIVCPHNIARLATWVIAAVGETHPLLIRPDHTAPSASYEPAAPVPQVCDEPLPPPPGEAEVLAYQADLVPVRAFTDWRAQAAGLARDRARDLVLAVSELAANTLRHAGGHGRLTVWQEEGELICQVDDDGRIDDPLAGRRRPEPSARGGQGLWVVQQVCDLVEVRTGQGGTSIRLHMRLAC